MSEFLEPLYRADVLRWYGSALVFIERLALNEGMMKPELRDLVAQNFRGLWSSAAMYEELEKLSLRFAADGFWREGWIACRQIMHYDKNRLTSEVASRLFALETVLRPSNLQEQVRAVVLGDMTGRPSLEIVDIEDDFASAYSRLAAMARELGATVATHDDVFAEFLPDLLRGGNQAWAFGRGLAGASPELRATWARLVEGLEQIAPEQRNVQVLIGFLAELWERDRDLAQHLLDSAVNQPVLVVFLPVLHSAVELDEYGVERLKQVLNAGLVPIHVYRSLAVGQTTDHLSGEALKDLLLLIADQPDGFDVAVDILSMRLHSDSSAQRGHEPELLDVGRELLQRVIFRRGNHEGDYELAGIAKACLTDPNAGQVAAEVTARLRQAVVTHETYSFHHDYLLKALLELQPEMALNALFADDEDDQWVGQILFRRLGEEQGTPADIIPCNDLIAWCEGNSEHRYWLAASIITFARHPEASGPLVWSEQAKALIAHTPDPKTVLEAFIARFQPMGWSDSRAAAMEANVRLLDSLELNIPSGLMPFITEAKAQLAQEVAEMRQEETEQDRVRDERFE